MTFALKDFLDAVGPSASLIFAAWIFLSYLEQRYSSAYDYYRSLLNAYRTQPKEDARRQRLADQILHYKRRCQQMRMATQLGVVAAIFLITALIAGGIHTFAPVAALSVVCVACALAGLGTVIAAASMVLLENGRLQRIIDSEISDIPELSPAIHAAELDKGTR